MRNDIEEDARDAAIRRIHQEEIEHLEAQSVAAAIDRANSIYFTEELCAKWGATHVIEVAKRWAERKGISL